MGGFPEMTMVRLNSHVHRSVAPTPGRRVFGRTPKMPIGAVSNPNFADFTKPKEAGTTKTHHLLVVIRQIRQASLAADFNGELKLRSNRRFRQLRNGGDFLGAIRVFPVHK